MLRYLLTFRSRLPLGAVLAGMLMASTAKADARPASCDKTELGTITLQHENDLFAGTDQHYTSGLRLSWLSPEGCKTIEPLQIIQQFLEGIAPEYNRDKTRFGWAVGQDIYTPEDRFRTDLIEDDRPYAGWLYGSLSLHTVRDKSEGRKISESMELSLGVVGPQALGEEAQDFIHEARLIDTFRGWDHQLEAEPGILFNYERKWRRGEPVPHGEHFEADLIPRAGFSLGNVMTQAGAGGAVRFGYNLPRDFGPPGLIHGSEPLSELDNRPQGDFSIYAFITADGRYVARNIFLDGNTFRSSHSVKKKRIVGEFTLGAAIVYKRFTLAYTNALRTKEFDGQRRNSRFGSISASFQAFF